MIFFGEPADLGDGRLKSQNNHLNWGPDVRFFYRSEMEASEETKLKGH